MMAGVVEEVVVATEESDECPTKVHLVPACTIISDREGHNDYIMRGHMN
jgi:hypothetical protein